MTEPVEFQGKGRNDLVWEIERARELYQQATSQCTRAQQEREAEKLRTEKLARTLEIHIANAEGGYKRGGAEGYLAQVNMGKWILAYLRGDDTALDGQEQKESSHAR